ncbi:uncharacterized protein B0I36DRAFT_323343 [Microdochium trichocladiopsis]|uniref:Uncharacterized protein n=1 Tax=Microdochium trichocladiopsis TaxID=1682393 RepID=A0A9P9BQT2_9PEZI|nr:uncharacterized protein B0I36DRAFT_323343 [Microdochium trichocladiopsis]KAH7031175.1 hypothetical protein B0I36DRAFT_323343 [Microdochium trichocladiopsis]
MRTMSRLKSWSLSSQGDGTSENTHARRHGVTLRVGPGGKREPLTRHILGAIARTGP